MSELGINWGMVRAACRKRIAAMVASGTTGMVWNDIDDAAQDAVLRVAALIGRGKPVGWAVVVGTRRQMEYCRGGYRPAAVDVRHADWELRVDAERIQGASLEYGEMRELGLLSAQELRLMAGTDR